MVILTVFVVILFFIIPGEIGRLRKIKTEEADRSKIQEAKHRLLLVTILSLIELIVLVLFARVERSGPIHLLGAATSVLLYVLLLQYIRRK